MQSAHQATIRCLEVDTHNDIIISGGKDGLVVFLKIEENRLCPFNRVDLNKPESSNSLNEKESKDTFEVEFQIQSLAPNPSQ